MKPKNAGAPPKSTHFHLFIGITLLYNEKRNYTKYYPRLQNKFKTNGELLI